MKPAEEPPTEENKKEAETEQTLALETEKKGNFRIMQIFRVLQTGTVIEFW